MLKCPATLCAGNQLFRAKYSIWSKPLAQFPYSVVKLFNLLINDHSEVAFTSLQQTC